jgi:hypothetical protein
VNFGARGVPAFLDCSTASSTASSAHPASSTVRPIVDPAIVASIPRRPSVVADRNSNEDRARPSPSSIVPVSGVAVGTDAAGSIATAVDGRGTSAQATAGVLGGGHGTGGPAERAAVVGARDMGAAGSASGTPLRSLSRCSRRSLSTSSAFDVLGCVGSAGRTADRTTTKSDHLTTKRDGRQVVLDYLVG